MSELYNNKYRIPTVRLKSWNYSFEGFYFVTICTKNKKYYFGNIALGQLTSTEIANIAHAEWFKIQELRPDMNIELGEFVIMPNHIHGIIIIGRNDFNKSIPNAETKNQFSVQSKNLASIIRGFKGAVTSYARKNSIEFEWQSRYYEHIIRSETEYLKIRQYIIDNPFKWNEDSLF
ncbi:transposase [Emticicia fluvialis]|uniref:transposase n=1 Tax=Emticicia fluvialis TaxID=2974474 RepID=UPI0021661AD1|nr:transposase [Emticicia fluvialis]